MIVPYLSLPDQDIVRLSRLMNTVEKQAIAITSWAEFDYQPEVYVSIAHGNDRLYLTYFVREENIRAFYRNSNDPVYKDSCVEFFISLDEKSYYNFEFNSLGTCLMGFGAGRGSRARMDDAVIRKIQRYAVFDNQFTGRKDELISWQLTVVIPLEVFSHHSITSLHKKRAHANFYKCGDELPKPHYLSWRKINTPQPDFHRPEYFGELTFA